MDPRQLIAGFQGALYLDDGSRYASATGWDVSISINTDDVQPLGQFWIISVPQGATGELTINEAVIDDWIAIRVLEEVAQSRVPTFRFVGERYSGDRVSTWVIDNCVPSGTLTMAAITTGSTATRTLTFRIGTEPSPAGLFARAA